MTLLAIDTSIGTSVAIVDAGGEVLSELVSFDQRAHIEVIAGFIEACLTNVGLTAQDLSGVAVGIGPAPFTGIRVGIAAAKGYAIGASLPLYPVSSHAALAWSFAQDATSSAFAQAIPGPEQLPADADLILVTDAKRGEYFRSVYQFSGQTGQTGPAGQSGPAGQTELEEQFGTKALPNILAAVLEPQPDLIKAANIPASALTANYVPAESVGSLAIHMLSAGISFPQASPIYLRSPDVTVNPNLGIGKAP